MDWVGRVVLLLLQGLQRSTVPFLLAPPEEYMNKTTSHIPTCVALDDVANPQDLWDLVLEGEAMPDDEPSQEA
jgi:hypothetical protein